MQHEGLLLVDLGHQVAVPDGHAGRQSIRALPARGTLPREQTADQGPGIGVEHGAQDRLGPVDVDLAVEEGIADLDLPGPPCPLGVADVSSSARSVIPAAPSTTTRTSAVVEGVGRGEYRSKRTAGCRSDP